MASLAKTTVRNSSALLLVRAFEALLGFLIAFIVPRLMGPNIYGQYVLLTSLSLWFILASTLGFRQIIGRYVGEMELQSGTRLREFIGNLISIRFIASLLVAIAFVVITHIWFTEYVLNTLVITGALIFFRALSQLVYDLFLGLNQTHRWAIGDLIRRILSVVAVYGGYKLAGLSGAMLGWLIGEVVVWGIGIFWTRNYLSPPGRYLNVREMIPYLRFGFVYFLSALLQSAFQHSGGLIVRLLTGDYVQVGYFGLAFNIYLAAALVIPNLTLAFSPFLARLYVTGNLERIHFWIANLAKWLCIGCMVLIAGALFIGPDVVPIVLGTAYTQVSQYLLPLMVALIGVSFGESARLLTMVLEKPEHALVATGIELVVFWIGSVIFVRWLGGIGGTYAVMVATFAGGLYLTMRVRQQLRFPVRNSVLAILIGGGVMLLYFIPVPTGIIWSLGWYVAYVLIYATLLFLNRLVTFEEIRDIWESVRQINR